MHPPIAFPPPPPTSNTLSSHQRSALVRSSRKLYKVLGDVPHVSDDGASLPHSLPRLLTLQQVHPRLAPTLHGTNANPLIFPRSSITTTLQSTHHAVAPCSPSPPPSCPTRPRPHPLTALSAAPNSSVSVANSDTTSPPPPSSLPHPPQPPLRPRPTRRPDHARAQSCPQQTTRARSRSRSALTRVRIGSHSLRACTRPARTRRNTSITRARCRPSHLVCNTVATTRDSSAHA